MNVKRRPLVIDIKRYSFEDGPGIRSVVFFKGCPLRCVFCHNPEAQQLDPEVMFSRVQCIECGACVRACQVGALDMRFSGRIHRDRCNGCGECAVACPGDGLRLVGKYYSVEAVTEILLRDFEFYRHSGGGVTLSGGECTLFPDYVEALLKNLKSSSIHTALETSGYFSYRTFHRKIYPYLDLIYWDIKLASDADHVRYCGKPNAVVLSNFRRLIKDGKVEICPRIPLVPGITATDENLAAIGDFLRALGVKQVQVLSYNPLGLVKFRSLGRPTPDLPDTLMKCQEEERAYEVLRRKGIVVTNLPHENSFGFTVAFSKDPD